MRTSQGPKQRTLLEYFQ
jgi:antitoxin component YwqK of YwqJK toxin-antitoxin module